MLSYAQTKGDVVLMNGPTYLLILMGLFQYKKGGTMFKSGTRHSKDAMPMWSYFRRRPPGIRVNSIFLLQIVLQSSLYIRTYVKSGQDFVV